MRSVIRHALGIAALVQVAVVAPTASGQAADQHACSLFQPSDLVRITGRKDIGVRSPQASKPGELRAGTTLCDFLNISMTLTQNMTPAWSPGIGRCRRMPPTGGKSSRFRGSATKRTTCGIRDLGRIATWGSFSGLGASRWRSGS
jgi:hypothetical protein